MGLRDVVFSKGKTHDSTITALNITKIHRNTEMEKRLLENSWRKFEKLTQSKVDNWKNSLIDN